jgi:DNA primase
LFIPLLGGGDSHLIEGYALSLAALTMNAIAVGGTGMSNSQKEELEKIPGRFYIFPDADEVGDTAARQWLIDLYPRALLCPAELSF